MKEKRNFILTIIIAGIMVAGFACGKSDVIQTPLPLKTPAQPLTLQKTTKTPEVEPAEPIKPSATETPSRTPTPEIPDDISTELANVIPTHTLEKKNAPPPNEGILDDLEEELFVSLGGGDGAFCSASPVGEPPAISGEAFYNHYGYICFWDYVSGNPVNISLFDPDGHFTANKELQFDYEENGIASLEVLLWFADLPSGQWTIAANTNNVRLEQQVIVNEPEYPVISVAPAGLDPLGGERWLHWWIHNKYSTGEQAAIIGAGFPVNQTLPLGIYFQKEKDSFSPAQLVFKQAVTTDNQGRFKVIHPLEEIAPQGEGAYYAVVKLDPSYQPFPGGLDPLGAVAGFIVPPATDNVRKDVDKIYVHQEANTRLIYTKEKATLINISNKPISLKGVVFKRVNKNGEVNAEFSTDAWEAIAVQPITALPSFGCLHVHIPKNLGAIPESCKDTWGYLQRSINNLQAHFWVYAKDSNEFQVWQNENLIQTCDIDVGSCEFYLP